MSGSAFIFDTEFSPEGDVLQGGERSFYSRNEATELASRARQEGEQAAQAQGVAALYAFMSNIGAIHAGLAQAAAQVREEAAELALAAARKIAGAALDANGQAAAAEALSEAIRNLKSGPAIIVSVPKDAMQALLPHLEKLKASGAADAIRLEPNDNARPGDWRIEWDDGAQSFDREQVADAVEAAVRARLQDPVATQPDLFSAA